MKRTVNQMVPSPQSNWSPTRVAAFACVAWAASVGGPFVDAAPPLSLEQARTSFTIAEAPAAALTVGDAQKLLEKAPKNRATVTIVGRIAAREGEDPFLEGKASFVLMDLPDDDHSTKKGHDADNCPFCKRRQAKAALAAVQFVDAEGGVVPIDARTLFGVSGGAKVVLRGQGYFNPKLPFPIVQLNADGMYIIEAGAP